MFAKKVIVTLLLFSWCLWGEEHGIRSLSLGGSSVASPGCDGEFFANPARIGLFSRLVIHFEYGWIFSGINDDITSNYLTFSSKVADYFVYGLSYDGGGNNIYRENNLGLTLARKFELSKKLNLNLGTNLRYLTVSYDPSKGTYIPGRDNPSDPIFSSGKHKRALSYDAGIFCSYKDFAFFGASVRNLGKPSLHIQNMLPLKEEFRLGSSLSYKGFTFQIDLLNFAEDGKRKNELRLGTEKESIYKNFDIRIGYNRNFLSFGTSWRIPGLFGGFSLNYTFLYPLTEIRSLNVYDHWIGFTIFGREKAPTLVELKATSIEKDCICRENLCKVRCVVENNGDSTAWGFSSNLRVRAEGDSTYTLIYPSNYIEKLEAGEKKTVYWLFSPGKSGRLSLLFSVDDNGTGFPATRGKIAEKNESNNVCSTFVYVDSPLNVEIKPSIDSLVYSRISVVQEEEPLLPVIFFKSDSATISPFYERFFQEWATRLDENRDIKILVYGFADSNSERGGEALARKRAEAVEAAIELYNPEFQKRVELVDNRDVFAPRISPRDFAQARNEISEENRRVELKIALPFADSLSVDSIIQNISLEEKIVKLIRDNPFVYLFIKAFAESEIEALRGADSLRKIILDTYPEIAGKVRIIAGGPGKKRFLIYPDGQALLYHPVKGLPYVRSVHPIPESPASFTLSISDPSCVVSYHAKITDKKGITYKEFPEEPAPVPSTINWDFKDNWGTFVPSGTQYKLKLALSFGGQYVNYESKPINIRSLEDIIVERTMVLVEFVFDEVIPQSEYLESRMEELAEIIISKSSSGGKFVVGGHTDSLGSESRNTILANDRAKRELDLLYAYLVVRLDLKDTKELAKWLSDHNIEIIAKGYGPLKPMVVYTSKAGVREKINIGDNSTPYGRSINRRVVVEWQ